MKTFTIIKELVPMFEEKMNKLLKKFQKYGVCEYTKSEPYVCENEYSSKFGYNVVDINIDIHYQVEALHELYIQLLQTFFPDTADRLQDNELLH